MILAQVDTMQQTIATGTDGGPLARGSALSYRISPAWPQPANEAVPGQGAPAAAGGISPCARGASWFPMLLLAAVAIWFFRAVL